MATAIQSTGTDGRAVWASLEGLEENVRKARKTITEVRHASEDAAAAAVLHVRRHPILAVSGATVAGAVCGAAFGFAAGWLVKRGCQE